MLCCFTGEINLAYVNLWNLCLQSAVRGSVSRQSRVAVSAIFTKAKAAAKTAYVCLDCGYLYDEPTPFEQVKSYSCPVCGAPKRR